MAIFSYKKAKIEPQEEPNEYIKIASPKKDPLTLGQVLSSFKNDVVNLMVKSKVAGFLVPLIMILFGINIIFKQVWPEVEQQIRLYFGGYNTESLALVEGEYISREKYLSNPGSEFFKSISEQTETKNILLSDPESAKYKGRFSISIPSLDLNNLPVTGNVDSGDEKSYQSALAKGLAHFKGTGLPFSPINNNIVIYGHSSSGDYYERTKDVAGAFSRLNKIKIGDMIEIKMNGQTYKFRVTKSKIVDPDETEIITGTTNKRTLTLFTCFPNGNSAQRFVAIANPVM